MTDSPVPGGRFRYIDWLRGLAVLVMIQAHTFDAWTAPAARSSVSFKYATILGGFAAPLFLWLAGAGLVLAAESSIRRGVPRSEAVSAACRRGLEIFVLAFLFRLQGLVISPGGSIIRLFRVDILNVMGPALVFTGLMWGACRRRTALVLLLGAAAAAVGMSTPLVRTASFVDWLPIWFQWYLRPAGEHTTFTLFPWSGFVFAGAATGALLAWACDTTAQRRLHVVFAVAAGLLGAVGYVGTMLPPLYPASNFWTSSPTFYAIRLGVLLGALALAFAADRLIPAGAGPLSPLERLGRSSLFVYWIHVELVYGYVTLLLHRRLDIVEVTLAYGLFVVAMYGAVHLRDRLIHNWRTRSGSSTDGLVGRTAQ
jgi:uncharacterized membrane protein